MDFKKMRLEFICLMVLAAAFLIAFVVMKLFLSTAQGGTIKEDPAEQASQNPPMQTVIASEAVPDPNKADNTAIQEQLDHDRQQQKQTKDLKIKLEQIDLELEQEKALSEIAKFKKDNMDAYNDPDIEGQKNMPAIKVDYIGGDSVKKEAIISIGGTSYQVKERSNPTDDIQVVSISDSSVTLRFSAPEQLTKTIDYKPE